MTSESKVYVAGHRGLVGSAILAKLKDKGYRRIVTRASTEVDLRRQSETEELLSAERPEAVFLAAAKVGGILANDTYKAEFLYDNITIASNVIEASYKSGVKKLLNLGSSCIYPKFCEQPMKEEHLLTGALEPTNEPYAIAKIAAIKLCRYYNEQYGTNFISAMPTNMYGPGDNFNLETSHVLPALIRKFHLAKLLRDGDISGVVNDINSAPLGFGLDEKIDYSDESSISGALAELGITGDHLGLWGSGTPFREFLYSDDLADACVFLMENYDAADIGELINVGTGSEIRIRDLAELIREVVGFTGEVRFDTTKPDGTPRKLLDVSRMKSLGWEPKVPLREGVERTYRWYLRRTAGEG